MSAPEQEPWVRLTLRLCWHPPEPFQVLLRKLLKVLDRKWGLKCEKIEFLPPGGEGRP